MPVLPLEIQDGVRRFEVVRGENQPDEEAVVLRDEHGRVRLEDSPLAEFLATEMWDRFRYTSALGWLRYDGKRWREVSNDRITKEILRRFRRLYTTESKSIDADRAKKLAPLLASGKIRGVQSLLRGLVEQDAADFDAQPHLLNCQNGVVDLRSGELGPHDPDLLFTQVTPVPYVEGATHPDWEAALQALPDEETRRWVQLKFGQATTGLPTPDDVLPILYGGGQNGKSSITCVMYALGGFAKVVPEKLLTARANEHSTELTELKGARLALLEELPEKTLNVGRLKSTLGTPRLTARRIMKDNMSWDATHSLVLTTNHPPRVSESDFGTWRRLALVTFPFRFRVGADEIERDNDRRGSEGLRERLKDGEEQRIAMLAWLVAGAVAVYDDGEQQHVPKPPERVRADTSAWRGESDLTLRFVNERLEFDPTSCVLATELYEEFVAFTEASGQRVPASNTFSKNFETHEAVVDGGVTKDRARVRGRLSRRRGTHKSADPTNKVSLWLGVRFRDPL